MPVYKANALVLRRIPLGETDKIVTLFTREYGKLAAVAKGSRRTTSRLAGATEPLMFLRALVAVGMNLDVLTQCEIRESFPGVRGDFGLFLRATYCCELLDKLTVDRDPAPEAFDLLLSTLYVLQRAVDPDAAVHAYELQLMAQVGYDPLLTACVRCDREFDGETVLHAAYSPARGGAMCAECAVQTREETLKLTPEAAATLLDLAAQEDARALAATEIPESVRTQVGRILREHLRYRMERDVRSTAFLDAWRVGAMDDLLAREDPTPHEEPSPLEPRLPPP
jgi:DNA repair protein RecO (recombination protein O)